MTSPAPSASDVAEPPVLQPTTAATASGAAARPRIGDAALLVGTQLVAAAGTFGTGIVLARALGPAGKGFVDLTLASATLLQMLTGLSLTSGVFYHSARAPLNARRLTRLSLLFGAAIGTGLGLLLLLLSSTRVGSWMLPAQGHLQATLLVAGVVAVLHAQQLLQGLAKGLGRFREFAASELVSRVGTLALVLSLAIAAVRAPSLYVLAFIGTIAVSAALLVRPGRSSNSAGALPLRAILTYSLPLYLGNLVQFLNYRLDIFFVKSAVGLEGVGRYTVAVWLAQTVWLVPNALAALVMRAVASTPDDQETQQRVAMLNRGTLLLSAVCATGIALLAGPGVRLVFGGAFAESVPALLFLLPGVVLFSSVVILSAYLNGLGRQVLTTWVACGALVVTIALNLWLVPRFGITGAAIASSGSYAFSTLATLGLVRWLAPELPLRLLLVPRLSDARRVWELLRRRLPSSRAAS